MTSPGLLVERDGHGRTCGGEPCDAVLRGFLRFFDRKLQGLGGNGRSCADCHMPTNNFQLAPAAVEARFRILQWQRRFDPRADDPLFRPIDADDFRINGEKASDYRNLRENGLVRITFRARESPAGRARAAGREHGRSQLRPDPETRGAPAVARVSAAAPGAGESGRKPRGAGRRPPFLVDAPARRTESSRPRTARNAVR